jgi:hypothetical protein
MKKSTTTTRAKAATKTTARAKKTTLTNTTKRKYTKRATTAKKPTSQPTVTVAEIISHTKTHIVAKWENKLITVEL